MASVKLGEDLEIDLAAYELRRDGRRLGLERIPMEILILLLEHRDELVTREQIVERVWGQGVFVDTDNSINIGIRKIRTALRDNPENPRFIRTVTGKGYRFIGPVLAPEPKPDETVVPAPPILQARPQRSKWRPLLLAAGVGVALAAGAYLLWMRPSSATSNMPLGRVMLAVLPFANLTGDPSQEYFSDGFTEEMIARLGSLAPEHLGVIARTSVMSHKLVGRPVQEVAAELGVDYVVEGSVRRDESQIRITVQLVRVDDQTHLWARQYDRAPTDLLRVQEEVAEAIADEIQIALGRGKTSARAAALTARELDAYIHYLAGRHAWNERTEDGFTRAIALFKRAIDARPDYAEAYAGLADCYVLQATYGWVPPAQAVPMARAASLRALEIDETLAAAQVSLALVNEAYDLDWETAESRFRRAIAIDPNYATAHHWYAELLSFQGRFPEALSEIERARQLDPLSLIVAADHGIILHNARRYDDAIAHFEKMLSLEPSSPRANLIVAPLIQRGRYDDALAHLEVWRETDPGPWPWAWAAVAHGRAGHPEEARRALQRMEAVNERFGVNPIPLYVTVYAGMGEKDEAFDWLEKACSERSFVLTWLKVDPLLDPLRDDPRFADLLRCARLDSQSGERDREAPSG